MRCYSSSAPEAAAPPHRSSVRRALLATVALSNVALALSVAAPLSGEHTGAVFAAATVAPAPPAGGATAGALRHEGVPLFFGFLEFDWDPSAPDGIPGFGPLAGSPSQFALADTRR